MDINDVMENAYMVTVDKYSDRIDLEQQLFSFHNIPFPKAFNGTQDKGTCKTAADNSHLKLV